MRIRAVLALLSASAISCLPATEKDFQMAQTMIDMGDAINEIRTLQYEMQDRLDSLTRVIQKQDTVVRQLANLAGVPVPP